MKTETATQFENAGGAFEEQRIDTERAAHLVADDEPAHGWADHNIDPVLNLCGQLVHERACEPFGPSAVHQDPRTLQILCRMAPGREHEMAIEQGAAGAEFGEDVLVGHAVTLKAAPRVSCKHRKHRCGKMSGGALEARPNPAYRARDTA